MTCQSLKHGINFLFLHGATVSPPPWEKGFINPDEKKKAIKRDVILAS